MSIVVRTLSERVFDIVREQIVVGELATDMPIRQDALAAELGVSKIPVREALARLEQEGLLISHPNRGYLVRPMSAAEADEIYALRLALEPAAAAFAAVHADDAEREEAQRVSERLDAAASDKLADADDCSRPRWSNGFRSFRSVMWSLIWSRRAANRARTSSTGSCSTHGWRAMAIPSSIC